MILHVDSVSSTEDITIKYVNHLLQQHAMDQHMLMKSEPLDVRVQRRLSEQSVKIAKLEYDNAGLTNAISALHKATLAEIQELQGMVEQQQMLIDGAAQREKALRDELEATNIAVLRDATATENASSLNMGGFSRVMGRWCSETFGETIYLNPQERACRLVEEAVEVAQTVGVTQWMVNNIANMVFNRPPGEISQELGGVIVCWAVMAAALGLDPEKIMFEASEDCWLRQSVIKGKLADKIAAGASPSRLNPEGFGEPKTMKPLVDEDPPEDERAGPGPDRTAYAGQEAPRKRAIDGDAAIQEGRDALDRHNAATQAPARGE